MRLDGEVYALADGWCPVDEFEGPAQRAVGVLGERSPRLIAELGTAAWIWGVAPTLPRRIEFCVDLGSRARLLSSPLVRVRELVLDADDRVAFAGAAVTSPLRTAVELARVRDVLSKDEETAIVALSRLGGFGLTDCHALLDRRRNLPEKRRAAVRLGVLLS